MRAVGKADPIGRRSSLGVLRERGVAELAFAHPQLDDSLASTNTKRKSGVVDMNLMQWPATAATVLASWLVASKDARRRHAGFWLFMLSNALWIVWGLHAAAIALVVLQVCLAAMNIRGAAKTQK